MSIEEEAERWKVSYGYLCSIRMQNGNKICGDLNVDEADFILRACRCHRRLVEAVKKYTETLSLPPYDWRLSRRKEIDQLIAEAEASQGDG